MTYVERMIVRRGHPKHIIVGIVAFLWVIYFLWQHNWIWAAAVVVLSAVLGRLSTSGAKEETLAQTLLGKIMLLHLHPVNLTLQMAGFALLALWPMDAFNPLHHGGDVVGFPRPHVGLAQGK